VVRIGTAIQTVATLRRKSARRTRSFLAQYASGSFKAVHYLTVTGMRLALLLNFGTPG
jgi:hypothetical protein